MVLGRRKRSGHARVDDLADLRIADQGEQHEGIGGVEVGVLCEPVAHHPGRFLHGVGEVKLGGDGVDGIAGDKEWQRKRAALQKGDADSYLGFDFGAADRDFAVAHDRVDVTKRQIRALNLHRQVERGAGDNFLGVLVAAVLAGLTRRHEVRRGRGANDPDHRVDVDCDGVGEVGLAATDGD